MSQDVIAIPFVDLGTQPPQIRDEVLLRMARVMDAGRYILGFEVEEFKQAFAHYMPGARLFARCTTPKGDCLLRHLAKNKIFGGIYYPNRLFKFQPFNGATTILSDLSVCRKYVDEILSLPMYPEMTRDRVRSIAESVRPFAGAAIGSV